MEGSGLWFVVFMLFVGLAIWLFFNVSAAAGLAVGAFAGIGLLALLNTG